MVENPKGASARNKAKSKVPTGVWIKCKSCREPLFAAELERNLMVCPHCDYHFLLSAYKRIDLLTDEGSFEEYDADLSPVDVLSFTDRKAYANRLAETEKKTGTKDAVVCGLATLEGIPISVAAMEFGFIGGSMGSVVGEKVARTFKRGLESRRPVVIAPTSGGARMQEGVVSLMQLGKTNAAAAALADAGLPYVVVISDPTTAGVMASYASVGDVIISEPNALMGFAGPRVIMETIRQELPPGFQRAEFQLEHGFVDIIVHRKEVRDTVARLLTLLTPDNK
ncbi:MAG: acetyl-CoA carboxylase carboxyltransferase subunit beta [candidate division Zixibacteria bacterium]|nr:acetyl-CoA carboxylase carboxyltransferase subunit beta [candidate division Zixibacteria bacterium]